MIEIEINQDQVYYNEEYKDQDGQDEDYDNDDDYQGDGVKCDDAMWPK